MDRMYLEEHWWFPSITVALLASPCCFHAFFRDSLWIAGGRLARNKKHCKETDKAALAEAKKQLVSKKVDIPNYYSET